MEASWGDLTDRGNGLDLTDFADQVEALRDRAPTEIRLTLDEENELAAAKANPDAHAAKIRSKRHSTMSTRPRVETWTTRETITRKKGRKEEFEKAETSSASESKTLLESVAFAWFRSLIHEEIPAKDWHNIHMRKGQWQPRKSWRLCNLLLVAVAGVAASPLLPCACAMPRILIIVNSGFMYINWCVSQRPSLFRGRHKGYRDIVVMNFYVCALSFDFLIFSNMVTAEDALAPTYCHSRFPSRQSDIEWPLFAVAFLIGIQFSYFARLVEQKADLKVEQTGLPRVRTRFNSFSGTKQRKKTRPVVKTEMSEHAVRKENSASSTCCKPFGPFIASVLRLCFDDTTIVRLFIGAGLFFAAGLVALLAQKLYWLWAYNCLNNAVHLTLLVVGILVIIYTTKALLAKRRLDIKWHIHVHHYIVTGLVVPLLLSVQGANQYSRGVHLFLTGICLGIFVEGGTRWSFAPLWYAKVHDENKAETGHFAVKLRKAKLKRDSTWGVHGVGGGAGALDAFAEEVVSGGRRHTQNPIFHNSSSSSSRSIGEGASEESVREESVNGVDLDSPGYGVNGSLQHGISFDEGSADDSSSAGGGSGAFATVEERAQRMERGGADRGQWAQQAEVTCHSKVTEGGKTHTEYEIRVTARLCALGACQVEEGAAGYCVSKRYSEFEALYLLLRADLVGVSFPSKRTSISVANSVLGGVSMGMYGGCNLDKRKEELGSFIAAACAQVGSMPEESRQKLLVFLAPAAVQVDRNGSNASSTTGLRCVEEDDEENEEDEEAEEEESEEEAGGGGEVQTQVPQGLTVSSRAAVDI
jgi:hypothetical protein